MIVESLKSIHKTHRLVGGDVSSHTKSAQKITKLWQDAVCTKDIVSEVSVSPENRERIDLVDLKNRVAYELKVSGKNVHHEFYKDVVKVMTYNEYQITAAQIVKLVFISEDKGIRSLSNRLDSRFMEMLRSAHNLSIELVCI